MGISEALRNYVNRVVSLVDPFINEVVQGEPKGLYDASIYLIKAGGKRLRPTFVCLATELFGGDIGRAIPAAAAIEILHNFTLIHDDVMDRDEFRRGVPTVHKVWGEPMAILAGDLLFAKSYEALLKLKDRGVPPNIVTKCVNELTWGAITVAEGQALDMSFESKWDVTLDEYLTMIYKKTAALFMVSVSLGSLVAGASERDVALMKEYAKNVGIAFQIRDDILGLVGDEETLGKPVLSDLREGKKTVLVIYALSKLGDDGVKFLKSILGRRDASLSELRRAADLITGTGAIEYSERLADEYRRRGLEALSKVDMKNKDAYKLLTELTNYLITRVK